MKNMMKQMKSILSMLLVFVMIVTVLPMSVFADDSQNAAYASLEESFMRVFHLDVGRKYFTVNQVKEIVDAISAVGYTHLELAVGNGGLRFLLDDMSVTVGKTTYTSENVTAGIQAGNKNFSHAGEWTQSEMDEMIAYATSKHIEIIPLVNTPGHMNTILDAAEYVGISSPAYSAAVSNGWWGSTTKTSATTVDLSQEDAVAFTQALVKKYVDYFAANGSTYFNIGADEYAADVHSSGSMGFGVMQSGGWYDDYVNYINDVAAIIKDEGMTPIAFNDGIYFNENDDTAFDQDIIVAYWIPSWGTYYVASPAYLVSKGHKILNTNDDWYYVIGRNGQNDGYGYYNAYNGVNNTPVTKVADGTTMSTDNLAGSMNCVWCDEPEASYEDNKSNVMYFIETLAANNPDYFVVCTEHEHNYEAVIVEPTCTKSGYTTYTCSCGDSYTTDDVAALGHDYKAVVTAPTCTESGYTTYSCSACGDSYTADEVAALDHDYEIVTVEATCTENGSVTYTCACGDTYTEVIPALGHSYESVTVNATCAQDGYTTYTSDCGDTYTEVIPALGHSYESVTVNASCAKDGYTTYTCACGDTYTEVIPALGHSYESVTVDATCAHEGYTTYTCVCGDSYTVTIPATGEHVYVAETVEATCTENGSVTYTCDCGDSYSDVIEATGHDYQAVVTAPTCTEGGYTTYTCACGDTYVADQVAALGHGYNAVVTAPTCTEVGYTTYTCVCGDTYVADEVAALGHGYNAVVTAPTCTEVGYTTYTCVCGDTYVADEVAALGHSYNAIVTTPTCETAGYTTYTCVCGDSYVADEVAALGHNYNAVVTAPTCTTGGYTTYTCACGDTYTADEVVALGHSYTTTEVDGYLVYTCGHCGHSYSEKLTVDLSYDKVTKFADGDSYVITLYSGRKYYALSHENNKISLVQVTVSNNEITSEITEDLLWNYENSKLSYEDGDDTYYLYAKPGSGWFSWFSTPTLSVSTSNSSTVSFSSSKLKVGSYYLRYSSGSIKLDRSATTTYLFQENET